MPTNPVRPIDIVFDRHHTLQPPRPPNKMPDATEPHQPADDQVKTLPGAPVLPPTSPTPESAGEPPHTFVTMSVVGAALITGAIVLFSAQSHWAWHACAVVLGLAGLLLVLGLLTGPTAPGEPSPLSTFFTSVLLLLLFVVLPFKVREHFPNELLFGGLVAVSILVIIFSAHLRRTVIHILVLALCCFLSFEFFQARHELRSGLSDSGKVFSKATQRILSIEHFRKPRPITPPNPAPSVAPRVRVDPLAIYAKSVDSRNPEVKTQAELIVRGVRDQNKQDLVLRLFGWVTRNVEYRSDPRAIRGQGDYIKPPMQTVKSAAGDCDDTSVLLASMLESMSFKTYLVFVPGHVLVLVALEPVTSHEKLGRPYGYIQGRPVFALESTRETPEVGAPPSLLHAKPEEIRILESVTAREAQLDPR